VEALAELSKYVRMAIVTTSQRVDFEIIHERRQVRPFMDFVLVREDHKLAKPHPEPHLTGLNVIGSELSVVDALLSSRDVGPSRLPWVAAWYAVACTSTWDPLRQHSRKIHEGIYSYA